MKMPTVTEQTYKHKIQKKKKTRPRTRRRRSREKRRRRKKEIDSNEEVQRRKVKNFLSKVIPNGEDEHTHTNAYERCAKKL